MTAQLVTREAPTELRVVPSRARHRSPRDNLEPAMLALVVYCLAFAAILVWPLLTAGYVRAVVGAALIAALVGSVYVAATVGTRR